MWLAKSLPLAVFGATAYLLVAGCGRSASWSPDGNTVATDLDGKLRTFDVRNSTFTSIDTDQRYVVNPAFSPNGQQLAYYAITHTDGRAESCDLWVRQVRASAGNGRKLASRVAPVEQQGTLQLAAQIKPLLHLAWSPDGRQVAYTRMIHGRSALEIDDLVSGATTFLGKAGEFQIMPSWSPDGKRLAYLAHSAVAGADLNEPFSLYVADPQGKRQSCLRNADGPRTLWPYWPLTWSRDGRSVAILQQSAADRQFQIRAVPIDGGSSEYITLLDSPLGCISSDFDAVVYMGGRDQDAVIYKHAPFSQERVLDRLEPTQYVVAAPLSIPTQAPFPVLSPDGRRVALPLLTGRRELRLYDVDSGRKSIYVLSPPEASAR